MSRHTNGNKGLGTRGLGVGEKVSGAHSTALISPDLSNPVVLSVPHLLTL